MQTLLLQIFFLSLPFQFALNPMEGIDFHVSRIFALSLFFLWLVLGLVRRDIRLPKTTPFLLLLSFFALAVISALWAENTLWATRKALFLFSYAPLLFVLNDLFERGGLAAALKILRSFVFGSCIAACIGIFQFLLQFAFGVDAVYRAWVGKILPIFLGNTFSAEVEKFPSLLANIGGETVLRATAFFPDPHMLSFFMGMSIPFAIALAVLSVGKAEKRLFLLMAGTIFLADLLSFSRGGYAGLLIGVVSFILLRKKAIISSFRMKIALVSMISGTVVLLAIPNPVQDRILSSFSLDDGSNSGRIAIWKEAVHFSSESPLFGYGLGNYPLVVKPTAAYREPIYAHNIFLDIMVDLGAVGLALFSLAFIGVAGSFLRKKDTISIAASVSLALFFGHGLFENPLYSVHIFPVLLLVFSLHFLVTFSNIMSSNPAVAGRVKTVKNEKCYRDTTTRFEPFACLPAGRQPIPPWRD
jgi:O-antigen ligase